MLLRKHKQLLTILVPVYNAEQYVAATIDSILSQDFDDYEIIIIDDCSSDSSLDVVRSYNHKSIKILENHFNYGVSFNQFRAIHEMESKYFMCIASDDLLVEKSLSTRIQFMENNKEVTMLGGILQMVNEAGKELGLKTYNGEHHKVILEMPIATGAAIIRSEFFDLSSVRYNPLNKVIDDYEFLAKCCFESKPYPFVMYSPPEIIGRMSMRENSLGRQSYHIEHSYPYDIVVYYYMFAHLKMKIDNLLEIRAHHALRYPYILDKYLSGDLNLAIQWCEKLINHHQQTPFFDHDKFNNYIIEKLAKLHVYKQHHHFQLFNEKYNISHNN